MSKTKNWLDDVQEGQDVVVVQFYYGAPNAHVAKVERVTRTQVRAGGRVFDRKTGREKGGDSWSPWWTIEPATPKRLAEVRDERERRSIIATLNKTAWDKLTLETLRAVSEALRSVPPTEEA